MSAEVTFLRFLNKLSTRDRKLYILLESYRNSLIKFNDANEVSQFEASSLFSDFFESEISKLLESSILYPIYESHRNDKAERSVSVKKSLINKPDKLETSRFLIQNPSRDFKLSVIRDIDKQFDEKLGEWASSFSDSEDNPEDEPPVDVTKRITNASDLSSEDE